ncbi:MAG TPA: hypothetical protein VHQ24_04140 [Lachnospiraceae bacterium]|nr:hypothetical protein [Lachnospiraceae bacterium]
MIQFEDLLIEIPFKVLHVEKISVDAKLNDHSLCCIEALIDEEKGIEYIHKRNIDMEVKVSTKNHVVFLGRVRETSVLYRNGVTLFKMEAISYTYDMDIEGRKRAFQDTSNTYNDVIKEIMEPYEKSSYRCVSGKEDRINHLLVQYEETDWEFLKRLASHFHTSLVVSYKEKGIHFYFGIPDIESERKLSQTVNEEITDLATFHHASDSSSRIVSQKNFAKRRVESRKYFALGVRVSLGNEAYLVSEIHMESRRGEIIYDYLLCMPEEIRRACKRNARIKGVSLEAIVRKRKGSELQVQFCLSKSYEESTHNCWFPYVREVDGIYVTPEIGSKVHIYFPNGNERNAYASHCLYTANETAANYSKMSNPQNKSFSTSEGQELSMTPSEIKVAGNGASSVQVSLGRSGSVSIKGASITLQSDGALQLGREEPYDPETNAGKVKSIEISAKNEIIVSKNACQLIQMNNETHFYGIVKFME